MRFLLVTLRAAKPANFSSIRQFWISADLRSAKIRFFRTRPRNLKWCASCYLRWGQPNLQIWAVYGSFRDRPISGHQNSDFSQIVAETSNCAYCVSYADGSLTCKFELNTPILDFDRFEVRKNPIFHNSSRRPQMVRFVLVTLAAA